ncbi:hypothetical protein ACFPRL_17975 [Pseudoclavibacter helvolus]
MRAATSCTPSQRSLTAGSSSRRTTGTRARCGRSSSRRSSASTTRVRFIRGSPNRGRRAKTASSSR